MTLQSIMTVSPLEGLQALIQRPWSKVREELAARASYNKTWDELTKLSQAELADIGLTRSDIPRIAEQSAAMCRK